MKKKLVKYQYHNSPNVWEKMMSSEEEMEHKKIFGPFVKYKKLPKGMRY